MKIITIVGARPQFIKAATVSAAIKKAAEAGCDISEKLLHTGQHYDYNLSELIFSELHLPAPEWNLACKDSNTELISQAVEPVLQRESPDLVIVYGDTNSTLAGALAADSLHIPIAHVEAGLRSRNKQMVEEQNRIRTDRLSSLLFCPTYTAVENLRKENITEGVYHVGDVMYDAALRFTPAEQDTDVLSKLGVEPQQFVLTTIHRAETADDPAQLQSILLALRQTGSTVVLPLHPRTARTIAAAPQLKDLIDSSDNIKVIPPVGYIEMLLLERNASLILTDSGGVQKEAYFQRTPCVTLRRETEWTETVAAGWNSLAGTDTVDILTAVSRAKNGSVINDYGNGHAAERIVETIINL